MADKGLVYCARQLLRGIEGTKTILEDTIKDFGIYRTPRLKEWSLSKLRSDLGRQIDRIGFLGKLIEAANFGDEFAAVSLRKLQDVGQNLKVANDAAGEGQTRIGEVKSKLEYAVRILGAIQSEASIKQSPEPGADAPRFVILVISDLHLGAPDQLDLWSTTKTHIYRGLDQDLKQCRSLDLVVFAGDLVHAGAPAQYEQANDFLKELWRDVFKTLKQDPPMIAVPGNHDLIKAILDDEEKELIRSLGKRLTKDHNEIDLLRDPSSEWRQLTDRFLDPFGKWQQDNLDYQRDHGPSTFSIGRAGLLPGDRAYTITKGGIKVGVIALNTSLLHICELVGVFDKADVEGNLIISGKQLTACTEIPELQKHQINLLVTHHPFDWLTRSSCDEFRREYLHAADVRLHLCGHMHEPDFSFDSSSESRSQYKVRAPALFGQKSYYDRQKNLYQDRIRGYVLIEMVFEEAGVRFRAAPRILSKQRDVISAQTHCDLEEDGWTKFFWLRES